MTADQRGDHVAGGLDPLAALAEVINQAGISGGNTYAVARAVRDAGWAPAAAVRQAAQAELRADLAATFRNAAAGRNEYADSYTASSEFEHVVDLLRAQATALVSAARVVEGDTEPLYTWLPSWRWSREMVQALHPTEVNGD